jgi:hypothetical protein
VATAGVVSSTVLVAGPAELSAGRVTEVSTRTSSGEGAAGRAAAAGSRSDLSEQAVAATKARATSARFRIGERCL